MAQEYKYVEYPKWIHHPEEKFSSVLVYDEDAEIAVLDGWGINQEDVEVAVDNYRDRLLERARTLGIIVNQRWTDEKLLSVLEKAELKGKMSK